MAGVVGSSRIRAGRMARRPDGRRRRSAAVALALLLALPVGLSACGGSGATAEAVKSCRLVERSLRDIQLAASATGAEHRSLVRRAARDLREAVQPAAVAAAKGAQWAPLATTLSESNRVAESRLEHALRIECRAAKAGFVPPAYGHHAGEGKPPPGLPPTPPTDN
jgi:hypothetical protein